MNQKDAKKWKRQVATLLESLGATRDSELLMYEWRLPTVAGAYHCRIDAQCVRPGCRALFGRFDDPEEARRSGIDCNPHTGKWNFVYQDGHGVEPPLIELRYWLGRVADIRGRRSRGGSKAGA